MVFKTIEKINNEPDISLNDLPVWFVKALDKLISNRKGVNRLYKMIDTMAHAIVITGEVVNVNKKQRLILKAL